MSSARLAAEAAFAAPPVHAVQPGQAQITVRRARTPLLAEPPAAGQGAAAAVKAAKGPRVFRVDTAVGAAALAAAPLHAPASGSPVFGEAAAPKMRRCRAAADRRPGPVVVVTPDAVPSTPPAAAHMLPDSERLSAALARVTPVLQAVAQARSFRVVDECFENQWQGLFEQAGELLRQIRNPPR
jgi:hypothetical protein